MIRRPRSITTPRRGFTLIETLLAAGLGALVMVGVLAIFAAMDRTDAAASRRFDETAMMTRLHVVMERVWSDLLIQDENTITPTANSNRNQNGRTTATSTFAQPDNARNGEAQQPPRPRVALDLDAAPRLKNVMQQAGMGAGAPQRLEVVLAHPPVPAGYGNTTAPQLQTQLVALGAMASRGVFELRPDTATPAARLDPGEKVAPTSAGWTLWYRPLPPLEGTVQPDPYLMEPTDDPSSVRLATGLLQCNWQVFKTKYDANNKPLGREKLPDLQAAKLQDLPAYVEMKVLTASGLHANWMFEVGWGFGPETIDESSESGSGTGDATGQVGANLTFGGGPGGPGGRNGRLGGDGGRTQMGLNSGRTPGGRNPGGRNPGGGPRPGGGGRNGGGGGGGGGRDGP